jgi:hypothetical protein
MAADSYGMMRALELGRTRRARHANPVATKKRTVKTRGKSGVARKTKWSAQVMAKSDAMDLEPGVFKLRSAAAVARSLKRSVEASHRRKAPPFRSAMSMLTFEINRAGKNLTPARLRVLNQAKQELRKIFGRASEPK